MREIVFSTVPKIIFGPAVIDRLPHEVKPLGTKALLVTGESAMGKAGHLHKMMRLFHSIPMEVLLFDEVEPEPSVDTVKRGIDYLRSEGGESAVVVGMGGGSALDAAKAIAGLAYQEAEIEEYYQGRTVEKPGLPFVAIPTTAGSGAEVTPNSVLSNPTTLQKKSIRSPFFLARLVISDPRLTLSMPPRLTGFTGMDALCQAIESFTSKGSNPLTDSLSLKAVELVGRNLKDAYAHGDDLKVRGEVALGSLMAGIALANARLGIVHGLAHPLGIRYKQPHGLLCAALLPYCMRFNLQVVEGKYAQVAVALDPKAASLALPSAAKRAIEIIEELNKFLRIPSTLSALGLIGQDIEAIVKEALPSGSTRANPREAGPEDLTLILREALGS